MLGRPRSPGGLCGAPPACVRYFASPDIVLVYLYADTDDNDGIHADGGDDVADVDDFDGDYKWDDDDGYL